MHNLFSLLFFITFTIFQGIAVLIQVTAMAIIAVIAAPFVFVLFLYALLTSNNERGQ